MKYRRLNKEELAEVEPEFIRFLASNSITGDDWVKMKAETPQKAEGMIDIFSDIVFDRVLTKVEFMEFKTKHDLKTFHCKKNKIKMMGLMVEGETDLDFSQNMAPDQMMSLLQLSDAKLKLYQAEKSYAKERELELFEMMESGCLITKGDLYRVLQGLR